VAVSAHAHPPTYRIRFTEDGHAIVDSDSVVVQFDRSYVVGDIAITRAFGSALPPELADLVDLALAVYVSDRVAHRRPYHADRSFLNWTRRFDLTIPVRDIGRWRDVKLCRQVRDVLWFLTEDDWHIRFIERRGGHHLAEIQQALFPLPPKMPVTTALFSGGLDSLAGLYCELAAHPEGSIVLFSASTNSRMRAKQQRLAQYVRDRSRRDIIPVNVPLTLGRGGRRYHDDEPTQRSRGFLFGVLGAVTALMAGADGVANYENGIGSINLPYTAGQLGTHSTRSTHPAALTQLSLLISRATGRAFAFRSPFLYMTKAQLCMLAAKHGLGADIQNTVSCDSFPLRRLGKPQCGTCTSCLLRRQSLYAARLDQFDASEQYLIDIVSPDRPVPNDKLRPLRMMLSQVESLRHAMRGADPWLGLVVQYPDLWKVAVNLQSQAQNPESIQQSLINLYRCYCDEWELFPVRQTHLHIVSGKALS